MFIKDQIIFIVAGVLILALFISERLVPFRQSPVEAALPRLSTNIVMASLNAGAIALTARAISATLLDLVPPWRHALPPSSGWLVADILVLDLWIYAWHRVVHRVPMLWHWHEAHHSDLHVDTTTALRFHPLDGVISTLSRSVVVAALDIPVPHVFAFEVAIVVASAFHHSNIRLHERVGKVYPLRDRRLKGPGRWGAVGLTSADVKSSGFEGSR